MRLSVAKASELSLGQRALRIGDRGLDVKALQESLKQAGFYFGNPDGIFGFLTMEAVLLWEKTFDLKADGVAGPEMFRTLVGDSVRPGRIIHTVKVKETLSGLSQRFGVRDTAWESLPGQGNPLKRIYPGMKLLLPEKMVLVLGNKPELWDDGASERGIVSGFVSPGWSLSMDGDLQEITPRESGVYYLIEAGDGVWETIIDKRKQWGKIVAGLKTFDMRSTGLDLRNIPVQKLARLQNFLKYCTAKSRQKQFGMIVLPLIDGVNRVRNGIFWANLPAIAAYARYLLVDPEQAGETPVEYERVFQKLPQMLRKLSRAGVISKTLLVGGTGGAVWCRATPEESWVRKEIPFREAKILQAMFYKNAKILPQTKMMRIEFTNRQQMNVLIYRNGDGWAEMAKKIARSNLAGLVIRDFSDLKDAGPRIIAGAFAVARDKNLS